MFGGFIGAMLIVLVIAGIRSLTPSGRRAREHRKMLKAMSARPKD